MAPASAVVENAIAREIRRAEDAGCSPAGHGAVVSAIHLVADEVQSGNADNRERFAELAQQIALLPANIEARMGAARAQSRVAFLAEAIRAIPSVPGKVAAAVLIVGSPAAPFALLAAWWLMRQAGIDLGATP